MGVQRAGFISNGRRPSYLLRSTRPSHSATSPVLRPLSDTTNSLLCRLSPTQLSSLALVDAFHQGPYGGKGDDKKGGRRGGDRGGTQSDPMSSTVGDHSKGGKSAKRAAARANPLAGTKPRTNAVEHMRAFLSKRWNPQAAMLDLSVRLHSLSSTRQIPSCRAHVLTT